MAAHSSILAWRIPWAGEPEGLGPRGHKSQTQLSNQHFLFHFQHLPAAPGLENNIQIPLGTVGPFHPKGRLTDNLCPAHILGTHPGSGSLATPATCKHYLTLPPARLADCPLFPGYLPTHHPVPGSQLALLTA